MSLRIDPRPDGFVLTAGERTLIAHTAEQPFLFVGRGRARIEMYRGNFDIEDYLETREPLRSVTVDGSRIVCRRHHGDAPQIVLRVHATGDGVALHFAQAEPWINRIWLRLMAEPGEAVWGCGEQMSYFDLRGRHFPLWTSEPGVGRDKSTEITWRADATGRAGGDYWTTNYPQPTFLSSRGYAAHLETTAYADFDFRHAEFHELQSWTVPERLELFLGSTPRSLVSQLSQRFGRQPALPAWLDQGVVLGLKRGEDHARKKLDLARARGMRVVGLWCEDWAGVRETSFGTRLFWDWRWNKQRYPQLDRFIGDLHAEGLRFLGYVNPYLCNDGTLFAEAEANGVFARDADGTALVDFGEFVCGVVDFTKPDADAWFRNRILRENMLDLGLDGWMADFGEYLPVNVRLANGEPLLEHNRWPVRWAAANARAIADAGRTGDAVFFMRAGYAGVQAHCPLLWGGDQSVDFSRHDGLVTTIPAALSAGLLGNAYHHTDIGGYTSLFGNRRTPELFMRWAEAAAFTAVMRTHEGNRPTENFQWWESDAVMQHFARMTSLFAALAPYRRTLVAEAALNGLPLQRPPMLHFPHDPATFGLHDHFMLGPDLLIAPVHKASTDRWQAYLPVGTDWRHVWSGATFNGGTHADVPAAIGQPPVFIRTDAPSFDALTTLAGL